MTATRFTAVPAVPVTRPRGTSVLVVTVLLAAGVGLAVGVDPGVSLVVGAAVVSAVVLVPRPDLAALAVVTTAVFADYLARLDPWATEWLMAVLLVAWAVRRAAGPLHARPLAAALAPAVVFAVVLLLATVAHPNGATGLAVAARYALLLAVFGVLVDCLSGPLAPRVAARAYVVACVLAALCGLLTAVLTDAHRVSGPLASDDLAFFLVAALPLTCTLVTPDGPRWPALGAAGVLVVALLGTQSRGAWLALVVVLVLAVATGVLAWRSAGALLAVAATGAALVLAVLPHAVSSALTEQQRYAETRLSQRAQLWSAAAEMARDHPALGLGPGAFELYHHDFRADSADAADLVGRDLDDAHSTPLQASGELGILGGATLLGVFLVPVVSIRRRWRRDRTAFTAAAAIGVTGLVVASLFETEQLRLPLWFLAALTTALGLRHRRRVPLLAPHPSGPMGRPR